MGNETRSEIQEQLDEINRLLDDAGQPDDGGTDDGGPDDPNEADEPDAAMPHVSDLLDQFLGAGNDPTATASDFLSWVEDDSSLGDEDVAKTQAVLDAYHADNGGDGSTASVQDLQSWLQQEAQDDSDSSGDGTTPSGEPAAAQQELEDAVDTIGKFADQLSTVKDMLSEAQEEIGEKDEKIGDLERRLSSIEDEPQPRSLASPKQDEFYSGGESETPTAHEDPRDHL